LLAILTPLLHLTMKKRILSGIQPTSQIHIGNYFGAVKNWVNLQNNYDCFFCVVDLHAITMPYQPEELKKNTFDMYVALLSCGIDPHKATLFVQSMVPEHTELMWLINCVTSFGELGRMTQFKDKTQLIQESAKENFISAGLFNYPILQAADILIYKADLVPVGKDQEQHLELSRNIAMRFNHLFGEFFPLPQPVFTPDSKIMSLADPEKKMSKSLGLKHYIGLFEDETEIRNKVKRAVTDIGNTPSDKMSSGVQNLFGLLNACGKTEIHKQLLSDYQNGVLKYKDLKDAVADAIIELTSEFKQQRNELLKDSDLIFSLMKEGSERARQIATQTIQEVRQLMGIANFTKFSHG